MPTVSRVPNIPRKIRDIKPKRQLPRNERANDQDDEWWHSTSREAQKSATASKGDHSQGVAASDESLFGTRSRFSRSKAGEASSISHDGASSGDENDNEPNRTKNIGIRSIPTQMWERFKLTPTRKKIKRFIAGMVLFIALKSIYFADLDDYQYSQKVSSYSIPDNTKPLVSKKSLDSGISLLRGNNDGVKSLSELLGDDLSGGDSERSGGNKFSAETKGVSYDFSKRSSIGQSDYAPQNNGKMSSEFFSSLGGSKSMSESILDSASVSFSSSGKSKSMSESLFGPPGQNSFHFPGGSGIKSALIDSYSPPESGFQSKFSSNSQSDRNMQSSLFQSNSGSNQQMKTQNQQLHSFLQQSPTLKSAQDSIGQSFQGLRVKMDTGNSFNLDPDNDAEAAFRTVKNMFDTRNQFFNAQIAQSSNTGLQCGSHGGPRSDAEYSELIYWREVPSDFSFTSPYYNAQIQESKAASFHRIKYLTFEMDFSGWNNIRIGFENMILLAHSMGRTLVLPPKRQIAHGMPDIHGSKIISFGDIYNIDAINARQEGLNIISMEDFLEREAVKGIKSMTTGETMYPPYNKVGWNNERLEPLWSFISSISRTFSWNPNECVLAFPAKGAADQHLFKLMADVLIGKDGRPFPDYSEFQGKPVKVDAPTIERFREVLAGRRKICMYDSKMHLDNDVVHFKAEENGGRLILPFYAFIFWEDWRQQLWAMRFIRDNLVYNEEIFCLAARMVNAMRNYVRQRSPGNTERLFEYDAIHIRRGDFQSQFPITEMSAGTILTGIQDIIAPGSTLYISTDERDQTFFQPLSEVYDLKFIGDFGDLLSGINPQMFSLAEQIVCSRSRVFVGTYYSTFSAYIVRLRGYYSVKESQPGYMSGALHNTYYLPAKWKKEMTIYQALHAPFYAREFPLAWRDIDRSL